MGHDRTATTATRIVACHACGRRNRMPVAGPGRPRCGSCHTDLPWIVDATDTGFDDAVDTSAPVLVDLWAPWCGPCRTLAPIVEATASELAGRLKVVKVNVDEAPATAGRFHVRGVPTLLLLRDGRVLDQRVGALPAEQLLDWVRTTTGLDVPA